MAHTSRTLSIAAVAALALLTSGPAPVAAAGPPSPPQFVYSPASSEMYTYAPSAVADGASRYYYTCHNDIPGQIKDHVYLSRLAAPGSPPQQDLSVLEGTGGTWDGNHVCDPSVVAARVSYNGATYSLAMFYLGTSYPNSRNEVGVAFANSYDGPWVKYPAPIVTTPFGDPERWGAGMPSATTVDYESGRVLLFYSVDGNNSNSGTRAGYVDAENVAYVRDVTLGDVPLVGPPVEVSTAGLVSTTGGTDILHNFDVAYSSARDRFYMVRERHPFPTDDPWYISTELEVSSIPGAAIWTGTGSWTVESVITPGHTGFARNHNPGILRTRWGTLPDEGTVTVVFTDARTAPFPASLWSYDLWQVDVPIP